jgi:hypothetical protein
MGTITDKGAHAVNTSKGARPVGDRHTRTVSGKGPQSNSASQIPNDKIRKAIVIWEPEGKSVVG